MRSKQSGLVVAIIHHCWRLLSFRGDLKLMPDSTGFVWVAMGVAFLGGMTEQLVRGRTWGFALVTTVAWLGFVLLAANRNEVFNRRLASAMGLLTMGIQVLLILSIWIPGTEWLVAIWSGLAVMHLLSNANNDRARAWR
ncbi:MAG: hypothetical protein WAW87_08420 [Candidatus Ferrigenium altingense]